VYVGGRSLCADKLKPSHQEAMLADIVTPETRSRIMASIGSKHTRPELAVRRGLFARGFRYRLHVRELPGTPDLVLPKYRAVVFVSGCFWHGHGCRLFRWPTSNEAFWRKKISRTTERDREARHRLELGGWRVATVWECSLKGRSGMELDAVVNQLAAWLPTGGDSLDIAGEAGATKG
jgi:DNA mismatch endonuclease, patch repair protein